ncbi:MAG TPA: hypothetical protein VLX28_08455 [Thermoanaerobaculia bacterium]|nr:hypothetical protein [Thermoanaerobaculia bacterium]
MTRLRLLVLCTLMLLVALPVLAERPIDRVPAGLDYWQTLSGGATAYSFASNPIPAGFFCAGSAAYTGNVSFEGVPVHTIPSGILGTTDTVIERLDDAVFDAQGNGRTRIRGRSLNLVSTEPLKSSCGLFKVTANLTTDQPDSPMVFHRTFAYGGTFDAQLKLRVNINFTNVASGKVFSVVRDVYLPTVNSTPFAMGAVAVACATPVDAEAVKFADGRPLFSNPRPAHSEKALVTAAATAVATGCLCNTSAPYQCQPVYSWHNPCATPGYDCEKHFTNTPCQMGYKDQCVAQPVQESYMEQLRVLYDRGYLQEKPETVLQKQLRSAEQIEKDQATRERQSRQQQQ